MFTGLIKDIGQIRSRRVNASGVELIVSSPNLIDQLKIDDSIAINGVCQTVTKVDKESFCVQVVSTTLEKSTLGLLSNGDRVNLELALCLQDRLGGHIVQGHVNGIGVVSNVITRGDSYLLNITVPSSLNRYIVNEGSITIDGISLTVAHIEGQKLSCAIIPHTWHNTILSTKKIGDKVNLEVDILAKYVEKLLCTSKQNDITEQWLQSKGF